MLKYLAFIALLPSAALSQSYGTFEGCALERGDFIYAEDLHLWDGANIHTIDGYCPVTASRQVGSGAILMTVACETEGEKWEEYFLLETTASEDVYYISPSDHAEQRVEIARCE